MPYRVIRDVPDALSHCQQRFRACVAPDTVQDISLERRWNG